MHRRSVRASLVGMLVVALGASAASLPDDVRQQIEAAYAGFAEKYPELTVTFTGDDFRHPTEREMIETLMNKNPGIRELAGVVREEQVKKAAEMRQAYLLHAVAAGPGQYPQVYEASRRAASRLGITQEFTVFVSNNAEMQEDVFGVPKHGHVGNSFGPFLIVITAGMTKAMNAAELEFVIARELGHVKANHRFYTNLAFKYQQEKGTMPVLFPDESGKSAEGIGGSMQLFFERGPEARRLSELSADRAGALALDDPRAALSALAKLARGDLEATEGFSLDAYLVQVETAIRDLTPRETRALVEKQGFAPFMITRVSELAHFLESEEFRLLRDRTGVDPFLLELQELGRIGTTLRHSEKRLELYLKDAATRRLDPLLRRQVTAAIEAQLSRRQAATGELAEQMVDHLELLGLEVANPLFDDLVAHLRRTGDARPFAGLIEMAKARIDQALQSPDTTNEGRVELEAKKALLLELAELAPEEDIFEVEKGAPLPWMEHVDLPGVLQATLTRLGGAAEGGKQAFLSEVEDLRPILREVGLKLLASLSPEEKRDIAELVGAHGGQLAAVVGEVLAAGDDRDKLVAVYERYFDQARKYLKLVPMFLIRSRLARVARFDV